MPTNSVRMVVRVTARPDKVAELRAIKIGSSAKNYGAPLKIGSSAKNLRRSALLGLPGPTRREAGCIRYELLQNKSDPADFTFVEEWASDAAIDAHFEMPHVQAALSKVQNILAAPPDIRRYRLIG